MYNIAFVLKYTFFSFSKYICSFFLNAFLLSILLVLSLAGQLCLPGHPLIGADAKNARNSGQPLVDSTSCRQSTKDPKQHYPTMDAGGRDRDANHQQCSFHCLISNQ